MLTKYLHLIKLHRIKFGLFCAWLLLLIAQPNTLDLVINYAGFLLLGITGAIFANSTGAGGGVVFVPFFNQLSLSNATIIATSFAIQCCGMTAGAITWWNYYKSHHRSDPQWASMSKALTLTIPFSILGILLAQFGFAEYTEKALDSLHLYFGVFSILLALAIYCSIPLMKRQVGAFHLHWFDIASLIVISLFGGIITAWLSVGVGELTAVYLILRQFNITFAIAVAVILSAFSVWGAIYYHLVVTQAIYWQVILFAGAGAVVGGMIAKHVVLYFSITRLKIFFATWVLIMGIAGLPY
ncbi:sulfite exporter TauE/SafE family protein [Glaciecola sp. 1036]|uniref:sulfite exporter TauE/SafE family protein n=1 Tax=Alteromonadaceae TaxID=72275 RepID=UPI003CFF67F5